jgi:hypothetical protein
LKKREYANIEAKCYENQVKVLAREMARDDINTYFKALDRFDWSAARIHDDRM